MGIKDLYPKFGKELESGNLDQFSDEKVAVDMYVWLHNCKQYSVDILDSNVVRYLDAKYASAGAPMNSSLTPASAEVSHEGISATPTHTGSRRATSVPLPPPLELFRLDTYRLAMSVWQRVQELQAFGVVPVCVFDGREVPMKARTHTTRQATRDEALRIAMEVLEELYLEERSQAKREEGAGNADSSGAGACGPVVLPKDSEEYKLAMTKIANAVPIDAEVAHAVIRMLQGHNVECIVAPYEADPQLAYLCRVGYVKAVLSVDSDLIAYYCPCIIKDHCKNTNLTSGECAVVRPRESAPLVFGAYNGKTAKRPVKRAKIEGPAAGARQTARLTQPPSDLRSSIISAVYGFSNVPSDFSLTTAEERAGDDAAFTYESFLLGCIMAGCDYVDRLPGVGIETIFKLVTSCTSLEQIFSSLANRPKCTDAMVAQYREDVLESFYCFAHHLVYCPLRQEIVTYRPLPALPSSGDDSQFASLKTQLVGERWDAQTAQDVCVRCFKDPRTLRPYHDK